MSVRTIALIWVALFGLMLAVIAAGACSKAPAPAAPAASVDEPSFCYSAVFSGEETIGCAETKARCETARAAAAPVADETSSQCWPVRLRLERTDPG